MKDDLDGQVELTAPPMNPGALQVVDHFKGLEEAAKDYTKPDAAWCEELYAVQEELKSLQEREAKLKDVAKKWKDRGDYVHGGYTLSLKDRKGSETLDKEALTAKLIDVLGGEGAYELLGACTKVGKPSVTVSVKKISHSEGPGESGGL